MQTGALPLTQREISAGMSVRTQQDVPAYVARDTIIAVCNEDRSAHIMFPLETGYTPFGGKTNDIPADARIKTVEAIENWGRSILQEGMNDPGFIAGIVSGDSTTAVFRRMADFSIGVASANGMHVNVFIGSNVIFEKGCVETPDRQHYRESMKRFMAMREKTLPQGGFGAPANNGI